MDRGGWLLDDNEKHERNVLFDQSLHKLCVERSSMQQTSEGGIKTKYLGLGPGIDEDFILMKSINYTFII